MFPFSTPQLRLTEPNARLHRPEAITPQGSRDLSQIVDGRGYQYSNNKRKDTSDVSINKRPRNGVSITDLLNPAVSSALTRAHKMTVPSSLGRTQSVDSQHYYQQLIKLQQQQQQPVMLNQSGRAATAGGEGSRAQGLVREALELDKLYDIACVIIESIWPNHSASQRTQLCSLRCFVAETHRQSRLGIDVLELCMFYLLRAKSIIQAKQRKEEAATKEVSVESDLVAKADKQQTSNTPPLTPGSPATAINSVSPVTPASAKTREGEYVELSKQELVANHGMMTEMVGKAVAEKTAAAAAVAAAAAAATAAVPPPPPPAEKKKADVTKCGRRMFVAALMSASKFMHDRTYSNRAWHKITKLPLGQLSDMERAFLGMIDYRLYVDTLTYEKFHRLLARSGMRNGKLMVCGDARARARAQSPLSGMAPLSPASSPVNGMYTSSVASTAVSTPVGKDCDLRMAMSQPLSISGTPINK